MLSIQSSSSRGTDQQLSANKLRPLAPPQLVDRFPELSTRYGVLIQFKLWLTLQEQITALEHWLGKDLVRADLLARLQSVPGIGPILGMTILLESGATERFASVGDYASYCRMVESVRLSNGKRKGNGNRRCGNRYLCWVFMEAANYAVRHDPFIRHWYGRKTEPGDARHDQGRGLRIATVDEHMPFGPGQQERSDVRRADVVQVAGDAERRERNLPVRMDGGPPCHCGSRHKGDRRRFACGRISFPSSRNT